jgi:site-specific recombinase XerD
VKARWVGFQSPLADGIARFLAHKRALGRRFETEDKQFRLFDRFLMQRGLTRLDEMTPEVVTTFLTGHAGRRARSYNQLVGVLRRLFDWLVLHEVLPRSPLQISLRRVTDQRLPYLFDPVTARRLLDVATALPDTSRSPRRGATYRTIFALLYGLGLRVGEASRLRHADVDLERRLLAIRSTKFGKSRLVPFGPKLGTMLAEYLALTASRAPEAPVFSFTHRGAIHPGTISQTFHHLVPRLELAIPPGVAAPRVHDLRHAFAVGTVLRWYRAGVDVSGRLFHLATFLGHVNPSSTAVYLTITTELLHEANQRFALFAGAAASEGPP